MSNISARSYLSNLWKKWKKPKKSALSYTNIQFHSFHGSNKVVISCKGIEGLTISFPISSYFDSLSMEDMIEALSMVSCIEKCAKITKKHHHTRRLCIYHNTIVSPIIELLISKESYNSGGYHLFCSSGEMDSISQMILRGHRSNIVRFNTPESNLSSMLRILRNEYEDYYDDDIGAPFDTLVILSYGSLRELSCVLQWRKRCYILLPYNRILIWSIQYLYRYQCSIEIIADDCGYCVLEVSPLKIKPITTVEIAKRCYSLYKKMRPMIYH